MAPDMKIKVEAWRRQHAALGSAAYRVTIRGRAEGQPRGVNLGKDPAGGPERFFTAADVEDLIPTLRKRNARGCDIYVTPIDPDRWYLVLDDSTPDRLAALRRDRGWTPALVQETSKHADGRPNIQAVFIASRRSGDRAAANALVAEMNRRHGDPAFTGAVHPFRVAAFSNKKPGKRGAFTVIVETGSPEPCPAIDLALREIASIDQDRPSSRVWVGKGRQQQDEDKSPAMDSLSDAAARWLRHADEAVGLMVDRRRQIDFSRVEYRTALEMLREGWGAQDIESAMLACADQVRARHGGRRLREKHRDAPRYATQMVADAQRFLSGAPRAPRELVNPGFSNLFSRGMAQEGHRGERLTATPKSRRDPEPE